MNAGARLHRLGEKRRFAFASVDCLGAACFDPCTVLDLDTKREVCCCRTRLSVGCPSSPIVSALVAERRHHDGWRLEAE